MAFEDAGAADPFSPGGGGASPVDLRKLAGVLRRFWWIPLLTIAAGGGVALAYFQSLQPMFRSTAEIRVERRSTTSIGSGNGPAALEGATTTEDLKTIEASFLNPRVIDRVVERLKLRTTDNFLGPDRPASSVTNDELMADLYTYAAAALVTDTRLIEISYENWNPAMAQRVVEALAEEGIREDREQRVEALDGNVRFLREEAEKLEAELRGSEARYNAEMQKLGSVSIDDQMNIQADQLRDLNSRLTQAKSERLKLESDYEQIQACLNDPDKLLAIESIAKVPAVERLYLRASELRGQLVKLAQRYGPMNPLMIQTQTELGEVEKTLRQEILQAPRSVEVALASAQRNEEGVAREKASQEKKVIDLKELALNAQVLKRQIDAEKLSYGTMLNRLNEEVSQSRSQPVLLQVVKPAGPAYPVGVSKLRILAFGLLGGLMAGGGIVFLLMQADRSVRTVDEAEAAFRMSVLAAVPAGGRTGDALADAPIVADQYSPAAEAFRALRTAILSRDPIGQAEMVLVTSALPGEGKSFCALNLAVALAQAGQRTLLVDAQLRQPALEKRVLGAAGGNGLSDYLHGQCGFSSVFRGTPVHNLDLVAAGSPTAHPAELLARQKFEDFLEDARPHYDRIVFDASAVGSVSDTLGIVRFFSVVCLVVRSGKTPRPAVDRAVELLGRAGTKPIGIILNGVARRQAGARPAAIRPVSLRESEAAGYPVTCPSCGRTYRTAEDFFEQTRETGEGRGGGMGDARICECGSFVRAPSENRRDFSPPGAGRREVFGALLRLLVEGGMAEATARARLLLTLKIWRNEVSGDHHFDNSEAAARRTELFNQVLDGLVAAGLSRDEARARLLEAIHLWRGQP